MSVIRSCSDEDISTAFKDALPSTYKKAHDFLAAEFGNVCYVYDRCGKCAFVYRAEFRDDEHCPRCCTPRWYTVGTHRRARAYMYYCPTSEFVKYLWRHPDLARWVVFTGQHLMTDMQLCC